MDRPLLRIGELSRRLGVSDHVLRAWESRYGLLQPVRSPGGFRLYSEADELRIRRMQAYLADGLSAAEAARGISEVGRTTGVPCIFEVLATDDLAQALARAGGERGNKGWEAAGSALEMASLMRALPAGKAGG